MRSDVIKGFWGFFFHLQSFNFFLWNVFQLNCSVVYFYSFRNLLYALCPVFHYQTCATSIYTKTKGYFLLPLSSFLSLLYFSLLLYVSAFGKCFGKLSELLSVYLSDLLSLDISLPRNFCFSD